MSNISSISVYFKDNSNAVLNEQIIHCKSTAKTKQRLFRLLNHRGNNQNGELTLKFVWNYQQKSLRPMTLQMALCESNCANRTEKPRYDLSCTDTLATILSAETILISLCLQPASKLNLGNLKCNPLDFFG